jgi:sulfane dehydrogenase subunit SoxC
MKSKELGRRRFLKNGAALAGLAVGGIRSASGETTAADKPESRPKDLHEYGERSRFETAVRTPSEAKPYSFYVKQRLTPLQDSVGIITPSALHFFNSHGYEPPDIEPRQHRLMIHGMVDRPTTLTVDELKRLPSVSRIHFVECAGNSSPSHLKEKTDRGTIQPLHGWTSCSEWTGVMLSLLLKEAGVQKGGSWIVAEGAEEGKHTKSIPIGKAMNDVIVAYGQNGEAVRPEQGYPLRLVVPGWEGINNVKWLRRIKVVDQPYMAKMESTGYPALRPSLKGKALWFNFEMGVKSVITFPSDSHQLPGPGFHEISGLAWSGKGTIRKVEVSTDGGKTWKEAEIQLPVHRIAHTRFRLPWTWNGEETVLQSRATDDQGEVQPTLDEFAKLWGVGQDYWQTTTNIVNHFNPIQAWKIARDGSVHNAML